MSKNDPISKASTLLPNQPAQVGSDKYLVDVYIAAPGTPLKKGGKSEVGHMYYGL
jgi:hypothetical protein